ncbi:MAG: hypothetical protein WCK18_03910 [Prolixibacteraceae bacterium]|jgi:hypothetical protein
MKPRESFVVYQSKLYAHAHKNFKEPLHNELSFPKMSNLNFLGERKSETSDFVVEWEVKKVAPSHTGKETSKDDTFSFIADW